MWGGPGTRARLPLVGDTPRMQKPEFVKIGWPYWESKPTVIVGNGTSIKGFDLEKLRVKFHVLAVKGAMFNIGFADAGFGLDTPRYLEWRGMFHTVNYPVYWAVPELKFIGDGPHSPCIRFVRRIDLSDISDDPTAIMSGGSSGFGALNLAYLKRASRIVLLGYDYDGDVNGNADNRAYISARPQEESRWRSWSKNFDKVKRRFETAGVRIINASPQSRIPTFEKMDIESALIEILK